MTTLLMGKDSSAAGKKFNETTADHAQFTTPGGLNLTVAVVADVIGGDEQREELSRLAVTTLLNTLNTSAESDIIALLEKAFTDANLKTFAHREETQCRSKGVALAAGVIVNNDQLYIAHIGNCRIYLYQHANRQLLQLTMDHTFANVIAQQGRMSLQSARSTQQARELVKLIGVPVNVAADTGLYINTVDFNKAAAMGREGYKLAPGDSIMVCTSGLMGKSKTTGEPLVTNDEIITALTTLERGDAARAIVAKALSRDPSDNITAVVLQNSMNRRRMQARQRGGGVAALVGLLLIVAIVGLGIVLFSSNNRPESATSSTATGTVDQIAMIETSIQETRAAASPTPSPTETHTPTLTLTATPTLTPTPTFTPTVRPALSANEIGGWYLNTSGGSERNTLVQNEQIASGENFYKLDINHNPDRIDQDATIYLQPNTQIRFNGVTDAGIRMLMFAGGDLFIESGDYDTGVTTELAAARGMVFTVTGSAMAIYYEGENRIRVSCYEGDCTYNFDELFEGEVITIPVGYQAIFEIQEDGTRQLLEILSIPSEEAARYYDLMIGSSDGQQDAQALDGYLPTATPIPSNTPTPTNTPVPLPLPTEESCGPYGC